MQIIFHEMGIKNNLKMSKLKKILIKNAYIRTNAGNQLEIRKLASITNPEKLFCILIR